MDKQLIIDTFRKAEDTMLSHYMVPVHDLSLIHGVCAKLEMIKQNFITKVVCSHKSFFCDGCSHSIPHKRNNSCDKTHLVWVGKTAICKSECI